MGAAIAPGSQKWKEAAVEMRREAVERLVAPQRDRGLEVSIRVLCGTPFLELVRLVLQEGYDLVVTAADSREGLRERVLGSNTMHLLRKCPCPVWVVRPGPGVRYERVLAAVDVEPAGGAPPSINDKIITMARSLAEQNNSEWHVAHVWSLYGEAILRSPQLYVSEQRIFDMIDEMRGQPHNWLNDLLARHQAERAQAHVVQGRPRNIHPQLAHDLRADVLVMGTVGRTGVPGLLIGNTAEEVLQSVPCDILAIKPDGWETPVRARHAARVPTRFQ